MLNQHKTPTTLVITCVVAIVTFCSTGTAHAQLFPGVNDTLKVSPWSWAYQSIGFYGYTPINTVPFNAVMEKNGYGRLSNWQFGVGLGGSVWRGNWNVSLYGYVGITPQESGSSTRFNSRLVSFGLEEYIGYAVLQNETFRLYPQLGIHINFQNYNVSERSASIDVSAIQPGMNQSWSTSMFSSSVGISLGIGGDARIPLGQTYKLDTNPESLYKMDLLLGFQVAYNFGDFGLSNRDAWNMNGARVNNLPGISPQGVQMRLTFGSEMRLIK